MRTPCPSCGADQWPGRVCCDGGWRQLHADAMEEIRAMRAELESQERAHAEEVARYQTRLSEAHRAHADALDKLAWLGHVHSDNSRCAACAAYDGRIAKRSAS